MTRCLFSVLLFIAMSNAYASFECFSVDSKGHMWSSTGLAEDRATKVAINFCKAFSPNGGCHAKNCIAQK